METGFWSISRPLSARGGVFDNYSCQCSLCCSRAGWCAGDAWDVLVIDSNLVVAEHLVARGVPILDLLDRLQQLGGLPILLTGGPPDRCYQGPPAAGAA